MQNNFPAAQVNDPETILKPVQEKAVWRLDE